MKRIILLLSICFLFFAFYSTSMYDENYQVVKTIETVEIRQYPVAIYASYTKEKNDSNSQFRVLAAYIFGANQQNEEIGMTSPVNMVQSEQSEMLFLMPNRYDMSNLPTPNNQKIKIIEMQERTVAAIKFSGYATSSKIAHKKKELLKVLNDNRVSHKNQFEVLVYDPPYKIINRRNELIVII